MSDVLAAMFDSAARSRGGRPQGPKGRERGDPPPHGRDESFNDDREFFARARNAYMAVTPSVGRLLYQLTRLRGATSVVEFGTSFGVSTVHLGAAVLDNGGGTVIGTEYETNKVEATRRSVADAGLTGIVEVREGDATETLARDLPDAVHLLFLDGAKGMYLEVFELLESRLGAGAVVVADNAARAPEFLDHLGTAPGWLLTVLEGEDLAIALRTG
ncbi:MAG: class I SAM-dependent methyltransferase [Pseudonocardia sp.]|nr:class I SAM-dependent methyltransferase [Pseudonocardia sp.]